MGRRENKSSILYTQQEKWHQKTIGNAKRHTVSNLLYVYCTHSRLLLADEVVVSFVPSFIISSQERSSKRRSNQASSRSSSRVQGVTWPEDTDNCCTERDFLRAVEDRCIAWDWRPSDEQNGGEGMSVAKRLSEQCTGGFVSCKSKAAASVFLWSTRRLNESPLYPFECDVGARRTDWSIMSRTDTGNVFVNMDIVVLYG